MNNNRPNVVLIMTDQHNAHVLGCQGHQYVQTPHLDRLAARSVCFNRTYTSFPLCVPSRMSFMTSRLPGRTGINANEAQLDSNVPTFAHALGAGGYEAVLCGRMHFPEGDDFHGFETRILGDCNDSQGVLAEKILGSGFKRTNGQTAHAVRVAGHGRNGFQTFDRKVTDTACRFIADRPSDSRPFCLLAGMMLPHNPLIAHRELFEHYMSVLPLPQPTDVSSLHPAMSLWRQRREVDSLSPLQRQRGLAAYLALTTEMDQNVGRILGAIAQSSEADNTIIIYASDHGDMADEHGMWWKGTFYEGSVRIPLYISWPARFTQRAVVDRVSSIMDIGPTVLDLTGCPSMPDVDGVSLLPAMNHPHEQQSSAAFSEYSGFWGDSYSCMIRQGPWKLIWFDETQSYQLFNLDDDPGECHDVAGQVDAGQLLKLMQIYREKTDAFSPTDQTRALIDGCGHSTIPHSVEHFRADTDDNDFDWSQLPE